MKMDFEMSMHERGCCRLIWIDGNFATQLWTGGDFSKASDGAEDEGLTDKGALELSKEIVRRWNAQRTFWSRLKNLFQSHPTLKAPQ